MKETSTPMPGRGGQIWRESRELAMATVRDWHPTCEMCGHASDWDEESASCPFTGFVARDDYCNHHTFLEATTIEPPA